MLNQIAIHILLIIIIIISIVLISQKKEYSLFIKNEVSQSTHTVYTVLDLVVL